jgi:hypothetical protein
MSHPNVPHPTYVTVTTTSATPPGPEEWSNEWTTDSAEPPTGWAVDHPTLEELSPELYRLTFRPPDEGQLAFRLTVTPENFRHLGAFLRDMQAITSFPVLLKGFATDERVTAQVSFASAEFCLDYQISGTIDVCYWVTGITA